MNLLIYLQYNIEKLSRITPQDFCQKQVSTLSLTFANIFWKYDKYFL